MRLARVSVRNVRSYPRAELTLGPGTTLLVGDVGAGKTSLLYAVEMALFGFAEFDASYLVRHGARDAEVELTLEENGHTFTLLRRFRRRELKGRPTFQLETSAYSEDGVTRRYSATELRQRVIELLGFPDNPNPRAHSDLWRWAVYVPQEAMRQILEQDPSRRLETVRKALGLEQYRIARENAQLVAAELGRRAERHTDQAGELARSAGEVDRWTTERQTASQGLASARAEEPVLLAALEAADAEVVRVEALRQREAPLLAERAALSGRLADVERRRDLQDRRRTELHERLRALDVAASRAAAVEAELEVLARDIDRRRSERDAVVAAQHAAEERHRAYSAAETELRTLRASLERTEADRAQATTDVREAERREGDLQPPAGAEPEPLHPTASAADLRDELERTLGAQTEWTARRAVADAEVAELRTLERDGVCPRCHQSVRADAFHDHLVEVDGASVHAREESERAAERRATLERELRLWEAWERRQQEVVHRREAIAAAQHEAERARARRTELEQRRATVLASIAEAEGRWRADAEAPARSGRLAQEVRSADAGLQDLEGRRSRLTGERARLEEQRAGREPLARDLAAAGEELSARTAELEDGRRRLAELDRLVGSIGQEVGRLPELLAAKQRVRERRTELDQRLGRLERAVEHAESAQAVALADAARRTRLLEEAGEERSVAAWINGAFRDALAVLEQRLLVRSQQEFQAAFSRFFRALVDDPALLARSDSTFSPGVEIDGEWTPPEALSGGERTALALAYRLALGQVVRGFGELSLTTLILDEPTDGFSPEQVGRMGELLDELRLPQVLIISHEAGLASVADRVVRIRKVDGVSVIEEGPAAGAAAPPPDDAASPPAPVAPRARSRRRTLEESAR